MNLFEQQQHEFVSRHIGPNDQEKEQMLKTIGIGSLDELIDKTIPPAIRDPKRLEIPGALSEHAYLTDLKKIGAKNKLYTSYIGQGYYNTIIPSVILRNVFENPGWYTQYTPYQAEISQGRLESLLNFQTMVSDLTALPLTNASLLDEGTAAAEAMTMFFHQVNRSGDIQKPRFFVDTNVFAQTKDILITRAAPIGIELVFGNYQQLEADETYFGAIVQYPDSEGSIADYRDFIQKMQACGGYVVMATDLLALTLLTPPGELGADAAVGSSQRFGVPMGFGGPHAAFFATKEEFKRSIPGRIIGISIDAQGNRALRMALQTREQHIKREKATSNICTAQALLANMAAMYAVYHGPKGLKDIANRVSLLSHELAHALANTGNGQYKIQHAHFFDTIKIELKNVQIIKTNAEKAGVNLRYSQGTNHVGISIDETTTIADIQVLIRLFAEAAGAIPQIISVGKTTEPQIPAFARRSSAFLTHPVFNSHHSETEMMRYLKNLENKDLSLNTSMISLGSCTMKLNAASELIPVSWPEFSQIHPFAPPDQWEGYKQIITELEYWLSQITGFAATSLQPNSGAQGEYAGLLTIRAYHESKGENNRNIILIPISAHGTNPASAVMAGMHVIVVKSDEEGHIDMDDLQTKTIQYQDTLAGLMVTYPSTHGVFEESIREVCELIHQHGGLVYMDGANMNAQVGLTSPGFIGADVCHLNLHKTFAIPHGGGGPGMGPICVIEKLKPFLPGHSYNIYPYAEDGKQATHAVSAAPFGSASILLISYGYIKMLGEEGITDATRFAILNANYMKSRLEAYYKILYSGTNGNCAHEFIVDLRPFKASAGIEAEDVAKRLMDYGFHAPTLSFPVPGTIMIEPTESENKAELDRFCDALISIYQEIKMVEEGKADKSDNPLKHAPHTLQVICANDWEHSYSRQQAAFPLAYLKENKFWPSIARVNNTYGDRNLICTCEPVSSYSDELVLQ
jgi:glycine dehydrogenase